MNVTLLDVVLVSFVMACLVAGLTLTLAVFFLPSPCRQPLRRRLNVPLPPWLRAAGILMLVGAVLVGAVLIGVLRSDESQIGESDEHDGALLARTPVWSPSPSPVARPEPTLAPAATPEGIIHEVQLHETLAEIADLYDADVADIIAFEPNNLGDASTLREGMTILVPGGRIVAHQVLQSPFGFIWPAAGQVTSWFGPVHPDGIDIGMPRGTPVVAAAAGQVTFVGGQPCCSYGYYVIIKHDQTFTTRYGQFSRFAVTLLGQQVEQGGLIGYSGATGDATEPHLHFELRRSRTPQNPLHYLP